jgi:hypothetical protein
MGPDPRVFPDLTTSRVITLERIGGMKIPDLTALDEAGLDHHAVADRTALIVAKMILEDGFFQADPHPGNFFIEPTALRGLELAVPAFTAVEQCLAWTVGVRPGLAHRTLAADARASGDFRNRVLFQHRAARVGSFFWHAAQRATGDRGDLLQARRGLLHGTLPKQIDRRIIEGVGRQRRARRGLGDPSQREFVDDDQHDALRSGQQAPECRCVAYPRFVDALSIREPLGRGVAVLPRPVVLEGTSVQVSGLDLIEPRLDQERNRPSAHRERCGLLGAPETGGNGQLDIQTGYLRSEPARLLSPAIGESYWVMGIAAHEPGRVGRRFRVTGENEEAWGYLPRRSSLGRREVVACGHAPLNSKVSRGLLLQHSAEAPQRADPRTGGIHCLITR